jgi:hypothetical protein
MGSPSPITSIGISFSLSISNLLNNDCSVRVNVRITKSVDMSDEIEGSSSMAAMHMEPDCANWPNDFT